MARLCQWSRLHLAAAGARRVGVISSGVQVVSGALGLPLATLLLSRQLRRGQGKICVPWGDAGPRHAPRSGPSAFCSVMPPWQVHHILQEMVIGGMVLETNMNEIVAQVEAQGKLEKAEVSSDTAALPRGS